MTKCLICNAPNGNIKIKDEESKREHKICLNCYGAIKAANAGSTAHAHKNLITICGLIAKRGE